MLLTRLPMKRGERLTVSVCIGVIIPFIANGILHLILLNSTSSSLLLVSVKCSHKAWKFETEQGFKE